MMSFEPQYKIGREIGAKLVALITIIDDTYDAYGTAEELEPFTEAIQRLTKIKELAINFLIIL